MESLDLIQYAVETTEIPMKIRCDSDHRRLAMADSLGLYLFCRQCNKSRLLSWKTLELLRNDVQQREDHEVKPS